MPSIFHSSIDEVWSRFNWFMFVNNKSSSISNGNFQFSMAQRKTWKNYSSSQSIANCNEWNIRSRLERRETFPYRSVVIDNQFDDDWQLIHLITGQNIAIKTKKRKPSDLLLGTLCIFKSAKTNFLLRSRKNFLSRDTNQSLM